MDERQAAGWRAAQRAYYEAGRHAHLDADAGGRFAEALVARTTALLGLGPDAVGAEIGCGAGRFTLPLLSHCRCLVAVDQSPRQLERLESALAAAGMGDGRCVPLRLDVEEASSEGTPEGLDFVVGHFVLHHLEDPVAAIRRLRRWLRPGGRMAFLEPNRWNPLYLAQIACCADMRWAEERGLYRRGPRGWQRTLAASGLVEVGARQAGFFPPPVVNRFPAALRLEARLERWRWLRPVLPFVLLHGSEPETPRGGDLA